MSVPAFHSTPRSSSTTVMAGSASLHVQSAHHRQRRGKLAARIHRLQEREVVPLSAA
jgi:hypothetical protein